jgi:hypothetical protein
VEGENVMTAEREAMQFDHGRSQKAERRQLKGLWWAFVLIWAGLIFGAESLDLLPQIGAGDVWSWIFTGAGLLGILGAIYRVATSDVPSPTTWDWVWGGFCLIIGLGGFTRLEISWPLILILSGVAVLASSFWNR